MAWDLRVAAGLLWLIGLGFGLPAAWCAVRLAAGQDLPPMLGFRAFDGPFTRFGPDRMSALLWAFAAVCLVDVVAGVLLWRQSVVGAWLALATLPLGAVFWYGFALPIPPMAALVRSLLIWKGWDHLR